MCILPGVRSTAVGVFAVTICAYLLGPQRLAHAAEAGNDSEGQAARAQHALLGARTTKANFQRTTHPDAQWFGDAGLGLFIHWGISSVHGGLDLSWGMMAGKFWGQPEKHGENLVTPEDYFALADKFKPDRFDPNRVLRAAKEAGFRYAVLTTKHHDGFAMWPSEAGDFGVKQYLPGVDFVGDYVKACRAQGLKVGLYYSPPDWHVNRQYMSFHMQSKDKPSPKFDTFHHEVATIATPPEAHKLAYHAYIKQQVTELLTRYGKIDLIWFDGRPEVMSIDEIRLLQPGIVVNPRMHGFGDFATCEASLPKERIEGWWELCDLWSSNWGYCRAHENYRSDGWMLERFTRVRGWGGNYLINTAPRADGSMPNCFYDRMSELAAWMKHSGSSVFNVKPGPFPERCNVPVTIRDNVWFVQVPPSFTKPLIISSSFPPKKITLLRTSGEVPFDFSGTTVKIRLPAEVRTQLVDVLSVHWD